jgi:hypothetical protein
MQIEDSRPLQSFPPPLAFPRLTGMPLTGQHRHMAEKPWRRPAQPFEDAKKKTCAS